MEDVKNCTHGKTSADWTTQIGWLTDNPNSTPDRQAESTNRVRALLERHKVVTVAFAVNSLGMPDKTVRRILDDLTPAFARVIPGRPTKWRVVARIG